MLVKILRVWKIEVNHIGVSLRAQRIIVRILYAQQIEQEGKDDLALGIASRAIEICILFNDLPDAEIQCIIKTGKGIAYITALLEGQRLIFRFELFQARLQLLDFSKHSKIIRFISSLDFGLLSPFTGRFLLVQIHFPRLLVLLAGETEVGDGMEFE